MSEDPHYGEQDETPQPAPRGAPEPRRGERGRLFGRRVAQSPAEALLPDNAPPPPVRRKRPALEAFSGFLSFLLAFGLVAGAGAFYAGHAVRQPGPLSSDKAVMIAQGLDVDEITTQLQDQGVIESPLLFSLALFAEGARAKLKAGEYLFKQNASLQEVIDTMVQGRAILHSLTIPEGLTSQQIVQRLRDNDALAGDIHEIPREGALLPETYKFQRGDSRDKLLQKMARDQNQLLDEIWKRRARDLPLASPYDLVTLASIVEKETGKADERPRVAGVFINRLRKHMRLQSDPTIVYGLVGGQGPLGRSLTHADVESKTVYNTYLIDGLPPGPIANPGRAALEAVANPSRTQDLYFVADGSGGHVFSDSLDAHNRNVQHWREQSNKAKATAPPGATLPNHDDRTENLLSPYGAAPVGPEVYARLAPFAPRPRLAPDPDAIARLAPVMPDAPEPPRQVADYVAVKRPGPTLAEARTLDDAELGVITVAAGNLDGPAPESAAALDGPAAPVENSALGYVGPAVHAAPNGKPRILDASEGTALDPLLNKSWDLNSPKTIDPVYLKSSAPTPGGK
ncbi:endolytic transglycosylase MltG [uncultured Rhodoblastus sp.]|uniref:endolytic transglycosylase MltG n=1 Tax=uncultured Rhodoblastus sp. TaxID=543037 RepID=UPI0025E56F3F|nr:endolytic transglycosylase MltG [uncultured Rhodoblastus sp.]